MGFSCHLNVPRAYFQLKPEVKPMMVRILLVVMLIAFMCYSIISESHFYLFNGTHA